MLLPIDQVSFVARDRGIGARKSVVAAAGEIHKSMCYVQGGTNNSWKIEKQLEFQYMARIY